MKLFSLGKLLHVFDIIKSFSSSDKSSIILMFEMESSTTVSTAYRGRATLGTRTKTEPKLYHFKYSLFVHYMYLL
jgi:hypothetical protein